MLKRRFFAANTIVYNFPVVLYSNAFSSKMREHVLNKTSTTQKLTLANFNFLCTKRLITKHLYNYLNSFHLVNFLTSQYCFSLNFAYTSSSLSHLLTKKNSSTVSTQCNTSCLRLDQTSLVKKQRGFLNFQYRFC